MKNKICSEHRTKAVWKEGVSKAGKAYAFWACSSKSANGDFCRAEIIDSLDAPELETPLPNETRERLERNEDEIARGKVRFGFVNTILKVQGLVPLTEEDKAILESLVDYTMTGT